MTAEGLTSTRSIRESKSVFSAFTDELSPSLTIRAHFITFTFRLSGIAGIQIIVNHGDIIDLLLFWLTAYAPRIMGDIRGCIHETLPACTNVPEIYYSIKRASIQVKKQ